MPRYRRQIAPGSVQHIISRFVDREFRLECNRTRDEYLRRVPAAIARTDWTVLAFALMSSHVHWALRAGSRPSAAFIKPLHTGFAGWLNATQGRLGPVFADRHRSVTCEGESAASLLAYIHNNPVRAGVVSNPSDSSWTSHRAYLGLAAAPKWLDVEGGLQLCGFPVTTTGRDAFHAFVVARATQPRCIEPCKWPVPWASPAPALPSYSRRHRVTCSARLPNSPIGSASLRPAKRRDRR
jgi:REP element-mobilizing transposase RayT